ncbi:hypothetical protein GCM10022200_28560 [Microbacterium awajiense]|uniref:PE domain-containing protein n=1 Tax=Microbacterium awajiense TaxID=415214 RepID=A0ABP7AXE1_9MICO
MRYSVDIAGVANLTSDMVARVDEVASDVAEALSAVDDATDALRAHAVDVAAALDAVFAVRRASGPGVSAKSRQLLAAVQQATLEYAMGDEQMSTQTSAVTPDAPGRGFGPVAR